MARNAKKQVAVQPVDTELLFKAPSLEEQHRLLTEKYVPPVVAIPRPVFGYIIRTYTTYSAYEEPI
jgi:hypothetical protein